MHIKSTLLTFTLIAFNFVSISQEQKIETSKEFELQFGEPYPVIDAIARTYNMSKDSTLISCKIDFYGFVHVQTFDGTNLHQSSINVLKNVPERCSYEDCIEADDFIYMLYSTHDKLSKTDHLFLKKIDKLNLSLDQNAECIVTTKYQTSAYDRANFGIKKSFDGSKILVYNFKTSRNILDKNKVALNVFTNHFSPVWNKEIEMHYDEYILEDTDFTIDKDWNVLILSKTINSNFTKDSIRSNKLHELITVRKDQEQSRTAVTLEKKNIAKFNFFEGINDSLLIAGTYVYQNSFSVNGFFYSTVHEIKNPEDIKCFDIPTEIVKQFLTKDEKSDLEKLEAKGEKIGIKRMLLRQIIVEPDNTLLLIGEKYQLGANNGGNIYVHGEILSAKTDSLGNLVFFKKLPKKQHITSLYSPYNFNSPSGPGYHFIKSVENYYFIFFDNIHNSPLDENKGIAYHMGGHGILTAYQLNKKSGQLKKMSILNTTSADKYELFQLSIKKIVNLGNNEFALESYIKDKKDMMIRFKIKE